MEGAQAELERVASEQLAPLLDDCLDQVGERLVKIADRASSNAEQNTCFEVLGEIRHRRGGLIHDFFASWRSYADGDEPAPLAGEDVTPEDVAQSRELMLCAEAILATRPAPDDTPRHLQPDLICNAMIEAMQHQSLYMDGRVILLREFARSVLDPMLGLEPGAARPVLWDRTVLEAQGEHLVGTTARRYSAWLDASGAGQAGGAIATPEELCSVICRTLGRNPHRSAISASAELLINTLREELSREPPSGKQIHPAEQRMLFHLLCLLERFFTGPDLDPAASGMLVSLRVSLLFAMLYDSDILRRPDHPVRQLMNELADTMLGWKGLPELETTGAWRRLSKLVAAIGSAMPGDLSVFVDALIDWRLYRARRHARLRRMGYGMHMSKVQCAVSDEQRAEVETMLAETLRGRRVPQTTLPLFTQVWSDVLFLLRMHGDRAWASEAELQTLLEDLLRSMQPDLGVEQRHEVMRKLPGVLKSLRGTLKAAGVASELQRAVMDSVEQVHSALLFGSRPLSDLEWVELDEARLADLQGSGGEVDAPEGPALDMQVPPDTWLEFAEPWRDTRRFKVYSMEIDPQLAVVINGTSLLVREIPWATLDAALRSGEVRMLDREPRFDRALAMA